MGLFDGQVPESGGEGKKKDDASLWDNIFNSTVGTVKDLPQGLWNLGGEVRETAGNVASLPGTTVASVLKNNLGVSPGTAESVGHIAGIPFAGVLPLIGHQANTVDKELLDTPTSAEGGTAWQMYAKKFPFLANTQESGERTAVRLKDQAVDTATGDFYESPYVKAYNEGRLGNVLMEDAANVGLVADIAGGGLTRAAQVGNMERAGTLAANAGDAAMPGLRGAGAATERAAGPLLAPVAPQLETAARLAERAGGLGNAVANAPYAALTAPARVPLRWAREADLANINAIRAPEVDAVAAMTGNRPLQNVIDNTGVASRVGEALQPVGKFLNESAARAGFRGGISREDRARVEEMTRPWRDEVIAADQSLMHPDEGIAASYLTDQTVNPANAHMVQGLMDQPVVDANGALVAPTPEMRDAIAKDLLGEKATAGSVDLYVEALNDPTKMARLEELRAAGEKPRIISAGAVQEAPPEPALVAQGAGDTLTATRAEPQQPLNPDLPPEATGKGWAQGYGDQKPVTAETAAIRQSEGLGYGPLQSSIDETLRDPSHALDQGWISESEARKINQANATEEAVNAKIEDNPDYVATAAEKRVIAQRDKIGASLADRPAYAPAAQRPQLEVGRNIYKAGQEQAAALREAGHDAAADAIEQLTRDAQVTLAQVAEQGTLATSELRGGFLQQPNGRKVSPKLTSQPASSMVRESGLTVERELAPQAFRQYQNIQQRVHNAVIDEFAQQNARTGADLARIAGADTFDQAAVARAAEQGRLVAYDPNTRMPVTEAQFTPETMFLPKELTGAIADMGKSWAQLTDSNAAKALRYYDKGMQTWKMFTLGLSPRWNVGNLVGNAMMLATHPGALRPSSLVDAIQTLRSPEGLQGQALRLSGESFSGAAEMRNLADKRLGALVEEGPTSLVGKGWGKVKQAAGVGFGINQFIDDLSHHAVYSAEMLGAKAKNQAIDRLEAQGAISKEWATEMRSRVPTAEDAMNSALKVAGDFSNLSRAEQEVVRRIFPFYPWYKHITQLAWKFPLDHPLRAAWAVHLADQYGDGQNRPDWLRGAIRTPFGYVRGAFNPFPGGVESPMIPVDWETGRPSIAPMMGGVTPAVSTLASLSGYNTYKNEPMSRPNGQQGIEWSQYPYILSGLAPQTRFLADVAGPTYKGSDVVRYDTGDPRFVGGRPMQSSRQEFLGPLGAPLLNFTAGTSVDNANIGELNAIAAKKEAATDKQRRRYEQQRRRFKV